MKMLFLTMLGIANMLHAQEDIHTETVEYRDGDTVLEGFLAYNSSQNGTRPGVLVVHEWWGLNDYARKRAKQLAAMGYVAFALDMYGKGKVADNPQEARTYASELYADRQLMRRRAAAGLEVLVKNRLTDRRRVAAIGFCFGGSTALELARSGADLAGVVSFHGGLTTPNPEDAKNIKGPVLVLHGGDDPNVTKENVVAFWKEMQNAGVDWEINIYGGAVHAFTNPAAGNDKSRGAAYNEKAEKSAWKAMQDFFKQIFKE